MAEGEREEGSAVACSMDVFQGENIPATTGVLEKPSKITFHVHSGGAVQIGDQGKLHHLSAALDTAEYWATANELYNLQSEAAAESLSGDAIKAMPLTNKSSVRMKTEAASRSPDLEVETQHEKFHETSLARFKSKQHINLREKQSQERIDLQEKQSQQRIDLREKQSQQRIDLREKQSQERIDSQEKQSQERIDLREKQQQQRIDSQEKQSQNKQNATEEHCVGSTSSVVEVEPRQCSENKEELSVKPMVDDNLSEMVDKETQCSEDNEELAVEQSVDEKELAHAKTIIQAEQPRKHTHDLCPIEGACHSANSTALLPGSEKNFNGKELTVGESTKASIDEVKGKVSTMEAHLQILVTDLNGITSAFSVDSKMSISTLKGVISAKKGILTNHFQLVHHGHYLEGGTIEVHGIKCGDCIHIIARLRGGN